jgi:hypothetical protein
VPNSIGTVPAWTKRRELCKESRFASSKRKRSFFTAEKLKPPPLLTQAKNTPELPSLHRLVIPVRYRSLSNDYRDSYGSIDPDEQSCPVPHTANTKAAGTVPATGSSSVEQ